MNQEEAIPDEKLSSEYFTHLFTKTEEGLELIIAKDANPYALSFESTTRDDLLPLKSDESTHVTVVPVHFLNEGKPGTLELVYKSKDPVKKLEIEVEHLSFRFLGRQAPRYGKLVPHFLDYDEKNGILIREYSNGTQLEKVLRSVTEKMALLEGEIASGTIPVKEVEAKQTILENLRHNLFEMAWAWLKLNGHVVLALNDQLDPSHHKALSLKLSEQYYRSVEDHLGERAPHWMQRIAEYRGANGELKTRLAAVKETYPFDITGSLQRGSLGKIPRISTLNDVKGSNYVLENQPSAEDFANKKLTWQELLPKLRLVDLGHVRHGAAADMSDVSYILQDVLFDTLTPFQKTILLKRYVRLTSNSNIEEEVVREGAYDVFAPFRILQHAYRALNLPEDDRKRVVDAYVNKFIAAIKRDESHVKSVPAVKALFKVI